MKGVEDVEPGREEREQKEAGTHRSWRGCFRGAGYVSSKCDLGGHRDSFLSSGGGWLVRFPVTEGATLVKWSTSIMAEGIKRL